ncbi:MAG: SpoIIE family protein phosphatase [Tissierellia bacterium]|nr:SpoIIE family protein phosphatase [Tissierellia bacterium]
MLNKEDINLFNKKMREYSVLNYQVLESMADWVRVVDYEGNILYANKSMKDSVGNDIIGMKCYRAHGKTEPCGFCISRRSIETRETIQKEEVIMGKYFSVKSSPVLDEDGEVIAAVEVFRDVTRERKLELELIEKNTKMSNDLLFAKRLQNRILPKAGIYDNIKIEHLYKPCEMLSGDMFDVYYINEDNIGIYICDVVGHGVTASMMTMFVRQTMRAIKDDILSPSTALKELHKKFVALDLGSDKYFTIFSAIYNLKDKSFKYSNAGHNCIPIKFNSNEISLLKTNGFPISLIFNEVDYRENEINLKRGDNILFYTDGITEVKNIHGEEFGMERIIQIIEENKKDILNKIVYNVENFRWGEQEDDFAMVLMEVLN